MCITFDLEILLFGICPKDIIKKINTFLIAQYWKQPISLTKGEIVGKLWYKQTEKYYAATKNDFWRVMMLGHTYVTMLKEKSRITNRMWS